MELDDDFIGTEYETWDNTQAEGDTHIVIRETSPRKVREQWATIRLRVHEMMLNNDLAVAHITEELDFELAVPVPTHPPKPLSWFDDLMDGIGVSVCQYFHGKPEYRRGDQHYTCTICGRKYALPFADKAKLDPEAYICAIAFVAPAPPTLQAVCRNGLQGMA